MSTPDSSSSAASRGLVGILREFATADPRSLGLFRIIFGVFLLVDLYRRLPDYIFFYTNEGMLPNHGALFRPMSAHLFSIYHPFSTRGEVLFAFALTALVYLAYLVGYQTRLCQGLVLLLVTSLHSRNILLENGGDVVANLLALWTFFLPLGRRFSVDALLASFRQEQEHGPGDLQDRERLFVDRRPVVSLAFAAIVLNLVVIYYFNTVHKDGLPWREGSSVHYVLWTDRLVNPLGVWLRQWIPPFCIQVMTMGTLVIESSIVLLLLSPFFLRSCRRVAAFLVIALHCGFQTVGHYGLFSFVMMLHGVLLLGPEDWDALARRMRQRLPRRVLYYDSSCGVCHLLARFLRRLDHLGQIQIRRNDNSGELPPGVTGDEARHTLLVTDPSGARIWRRAGAVAQILRALPYGIYLARWMELPGLRLLLDAAYDTLAAQRHRVSEFLGLGACGWPRPLLERKVVPPEALRPPLLGPWGVYAREGLVLMCIVALGSQVIAENRKVPRAIKFPQPPVLAAIAQYPRFFQGWSMFAPIPPNDDGKVVVDAVTVDGRHIDPLAGGGPVDFELPPLGESMLMTQFWYEFHDRIRREVNARYREYFQRWLMNWHLIEGRPANDRIVSFKVHWVWRPTQPPYERRREPTRQALFMEWSDPDKPPAPPASALPRSLRFPQLPAPPMPSP
ncbi:MAG: DCC1-like thiol-disulfide oxidoreductase family protein [Myxococcales bacterium]|nr:DCC1-like thiol-disulfide oxidoreductase family protein [Polyangiaceae bacterium]MDW8249717.1 DCC1-like thiol-disulfide oxidoreductase family protein [Myxococcales bacterium]